MCTALAFVLTLPACATTAPPSRNIPLKAEDQTAVHELTKEQFEAMFGSPSPYRPPERTEIRVTEPEVIPGILPEPVPDPIPVPEEPVVIVEQADENVFTPEISVTDISEKDDAGSGQETPVPAVIPAGDILVSVISEEQERITFPQSADLSSSSDAVTIPTEEPVSVPTVPDEPYVRVQENPDAEETSLPAALTDDERPLPQVTEIRVIADPVPEPEPVRYEPSLDEIFTTPAPEPAGASLKGWLERNTLITALAAMTFAFACIAWLASRLGNMGTDGKRGDRKKAARTAVPDSTPDEEEARSAVTEIAIGVAPEKQESTQEGMDIRPGEETYSGLAATLLKQKALAGASETPETPDRKAG